MVKQNSMNVTVRSAPVLGRSEVNISEDISNSNALAFDIAAAGDGRTPCCTLN
jgi:hypothetical protein